MDVATKLIMLEGVPFSGKSTMARSVATHLELNGFTAHLVAEAEMLEQYFPHVLTVLRGTQALSRAAFDREWRDFAQGVQSLPGIVVVDGALSFAGAYPLLATNEAPSVIIGELAKLYGLCAALRPRVVHLVGDVARLIRASYVQRGPGWQEQLTSQIAAYPYQQVRDRTGLDGVTRFLQDAQDLMGLVLQQDGWESLTTDIGAGDWAACQQAVIDFMVP